MSQHFKSTVYAVFALVVTVCAIATPELIGSINADHVAGSSSMDDRFPNDSGRRCLLQSRLAEGDQVSVTAEDLLPEGVPVGDLLHSTRAEPASLLEQPAGDNLRDLKLDLQSCLQLNVGLKDQDAGIEADIVKAEADNRNAGSQVADLKYQIRVAQNTTRACKKHELKATNTLASTKTKVTKCKAGHNQDLDEIDSLQKHLRDANLITTAAEEQSRKLGQELVEEKAGIETANGKLKTAESKYEVSKKDLEDAKAEAKKWKERVLSTLSKLDAQSNPNWQKEKLEALDLTIKSSPEIKKDAK